MDLSKLGKSRVQGSINTQWQSNLAIERILIGLEGGAVGFTKILTTLEFIGNVLLVVYCAFLITFLLCTRLLLFLVYIYKYIRGYDTPKQEFVGESGISDAQDREYTKNDLTDSDFEEMQKHL